MSKNQAAPKLPIRRATNGIAREPGEKNEAFNGFATPFCGASVRPQHHFDGE
jgi:hypothetical protein